MKKDGEEWEVEIHKKDRETEVEEEEARDGGGGRRYGRWWNMEDNELWAMVESEGQ